MVSEKEEGESKEGSREAAVARERAAADAGRGPAAAVRLARTDRPTILASLVLLMTGGSTSGTDRPRSQWAASRCLYFVLIQLRS